MFTSKQELSENWGVDPQIAAFFVDRAVPKNNKYWKGRYLYVARGTGYLFIPLFFDLQLRAGIDRKVLLNEDYILLMEAILDFAGLYEAGEMDFHTHIRKIEDLVAIRSVQPWLLQELSGYFARFPPQQTGSLGTGNEALNRGDALLYMLTVLTEKEETIRRIINYWYLLVPSFLMLDDIMDLQEDQENQEENSLVYFGFDAAGIKKALDYLELRFSELITVSPLMGGMLKNTLDKKKETLYFKHILNQ